MGWGSGSYLMIDIIRALKRARISPKDRTKIYKVLIPAFEDHDCDTLYECVDDDAAFKQVYEKLNPPEEYDEDDYV